MTSQPRTPMDVANEVLDWVDNRRPQYPRSQVEEVRELAVILAKWRAEIVAGERGER